MNPRIEKIKDEIEKIKVRMNKSQIRLRELENQLTNLENADIVAVVRSVDIAPDELAAFVRMLLPLLRMKPYGLRHMADLWA